MNIDVQKKSRVVFLNVYEKEHGLVMLLSILLWKCNHLPVCHAVLAAHVLQDKKGVYNVVFAYQVESAGIYAAKAAVRIAEALQHNMLIILMTI